MKMITQINKSQTFNLVRKTARPVLFGLLGLFVAGSSMAQSRTITLDEAVKLGIENSKTLKLSQSKIDEAVTQYNQAKDKALPTGSASFGYSRAQIPASNLALGGNNIDLPKSANAYLGIVSLNQPIYNGGRIKYGQLSTELLTNIARLDADRNKDEIAYGIINSYYTLYKVIQSQKVVEQNLNTIDQQIHQAQRFFEQGIVTKNDVLRFQLQRANIELSKIDLESNRKVINYNMNVLLGLPETTELNIDQITEANRQIAPLTSYLDSAMVNRQELKAFPLRDRVAETNIKSVKSNQLPNLAASAGGYYVNISSNPVPKNGNYITPLTAGLTVSWSMSSLWTNKNKVAEAKVQREEVSFNQGITVDNIKKEVNQDYQDYMQAVNKINLLQTSIAQATENNKIVGSKYQSNVASATDRADAQILLFQAQINLELAKADAGLAYYTLLKSTGKLNK